MNSIPAENRELTLAESINQRNPTPKPKAPGTGYYLALTFGTLLSSQGADAQQVDPLGFSCWLVVQPAPVSGCSLTGSPARRPSRAARRRRNVTRPPTGSARGPGEVPVTSPRPALRRPRGDGTARSPAGPRASSSWGCSAPRCAGRSPP